MCRTTPKVTLEGTVNSDKLDKVLYVDVKAGGCCERGWCN